MNNLPDNVPAWPQPSPQQTPARAPNAPERMSTAEARHRAKTLKRVALAGTALTFCALSGLAAAHVTGVTSAAAAGAPTTVPANRDDDHRFFSGGPESNDEGQQNGQSGGFNFGSGGGFQPPAASSGGS